MVESSYNTDYYGDENNKKPSFINKIKLAFGGLSLVASIIILLSLVSYLFTGFDDHSLINSGLSIDSLDFLIIFPWNISSEIIKNLDYLKKRGTKFIIAIPELTIL